MKINDNNWVSSCFECVSNNANSILGNINIGSNMTFQI